MTPILISDAVSRLELKNIPITRQRLYQYIYAGKLSFLQRKDFSGSGRARPGGRILVDWDEVSILFLFHPKKRS